MDRKDFIVKVDQLSDRELRQLFSFVYEILDENDEIDQLAEEIDSIINQRNI